MNMTFSKTSIAFLESLLSQPSPVGFESTGQQIWVDYLKEAADEMIYDPYGSAAAKLAVNPKSITVMLEAHCDEIGMMIRYIDDKGFIYITRLGGSDPSIARAKKVNIHTKKGIVRGIVGNTAIHIQDRENNKLPKWHELFIDIGAADREEAESMVSIGNTITYIEEPEFINDELITARGLDNRIGGFIIAETFNQLAKIKSSLQVNVAIVNSVQEEIGGYGAKMMTSRIQPDIAIVTDVTHATDTPGINHKEHGLITLGKGAAVAHGAANHPNFVSHIVSVAEMNKIDIQHESTSIRTGTDTDSIYHQNGGIPSALISLPLRYMHSPVEIASLKDVNSVIDLMVNTVKSLERKHSFSVFNS